ncbi:glutaredoxin family protein [Pseudorhodoferax sp.]|uniref:glutaredoxin family protein n=1 Tax=Pseudorhodoferax sp. TaxID=1993553 RepID=UPI002DD68D49|nr:glutaredoxin family protein [Pseudorhodoferax sp.]
MGRGASPACRTTATGILLLAAGLASAQTVYRSIGADGRVTFSDRPPTAAASAAAAPGRPAAAPSGPALPYELQQVVSRFPVVLYTGTECGPCDSARELLAARGVPFNERSVRSNEDIAALQRLSGDTSLPVATIGGQRLKGFAPSEWTQYLDSAGYPRSSQLPTGYRRPPAQPLVGERAAVPAVPASAPAQAGAPQPAAPPAAPANPAGIVF